LLIEEAGGVITDSRGIPLNFGLGRTLGENWGVVAAGKAAHSKVIEAIKKAREEEEAQEALKSKA
jgi:3'(2'), 5'-bisphosphate nucleotidase